MAKNSTTKERSDLVKKYFKKVRWRSACKDVIVLRSYGGSESGARRKCRAPCVQADVDGHKNIVRKEFVEFYRFVPS